MAIASILALLTAMLHAAFVVFVVLGGWLVRRWPRLGWLHAPAALYGIAIVIFGWRCPLSDLEIALRRRAGQSPQWSSFIDHYILRPLGLDGGEWFVAPAAVASILLASGWPYLRVALRTGG